MTSRIKPYTLVEFIPSGKQNNQKSNKKPRSVDIVPTDWLLYDTKQNVLCKFLPPPYTQERCQILTELVEKRSPAPEDYPLYPANIVSHADSYAQALVRLQELESKKTAFTTDSEETNKKTVNNIIKVLKRKNKDPSYLKYLFENAADPEPEIVVNDLEECQNSSNSEDGSWLDDYSNKDTDQSTSDYEFLTDLPAKRKKSRSNNHKPKKLKVSASKKKCSQPRFATFRVFPKTNIKKMKLPKKSPTVQIIPAKEDKSFQKSISKSEEASTIQASTPQTFSDNALPEISTATDTDAMDLDTTSVWNPPPTQSNISSNFSIIPRLETSNMKTFSMADFSDALNKLLTLDEKINKVISNQQALDKKLDKMDKRQQAALQVFTQSQLEKDNLQQHADSLTTEDFKIKYNIQLPLDTFEDFELFEEKLKTPEIYQAFKLLIKYIEKGNSVTIALTNILKKFMTRNLAMKCNMCINRSKDKYLVGDTIFVKTIVEYITNYLNRDVKEGAQPLVTTKMVASSFGIVFTNSKDWDGHRSKRSVSEAAKVNEI